MRHHAAGAPRYARSIRVTAHYSIASIGVAAYDDGS
jgi:hypothetical protein